MRAPEVFPPLSESHYLLPDWRTQLKHPEFLRVSLFRKWNFQVVPIRQGRGKSKLKSVDNFWYFPISLETDFVISLETDFVSF